MARKDFADQFQSEGEAAREGLNNLRVQAIDALDLMLSEAPQEGSTRERYIYARDNVLPLLPKIQDPVEREAVLKDVAGSLKLGVRDLRDTVARMEEQESHSSSEALEESAEAVPAPPPEEVEDLIACPGVLDRYVEDVARIHGVVRDRGALRLQGLVAFGAQVELLPNGRPAGANLVLTAKAGRGKNTICDAVAVALPEDFCKEFESASAKSFYYQAENDPTVLAHTWLYPNEAEAADLLVEMLRPLLSGGKATHLTVNKNAEGRNAAQELTLQGPVSVTIPTIRNKLDVQLQTRTLVGELEDYEGRVAEHSRAVSRQLLPEYSSEDHTPRIAAWRTGLRSLTAVRRVIFDLDHPGFCFDSDEVSYGARLWGNLLGLKVAHAWLEQRNRKIMDLPGGERAVVATPEDYEAAYDIFRDTCERSVVNLSDTHRKILDAVYELEQENDSDRGYSLREIADEADVHHSTVADHKAYLTTSVKLLREAEGGGLRLVTGAEPSWWEKGDLLEGFPRPEQVWRWWEEQHHRPVSDAARQPRHLRSEAADPLIHGENPVGHPDRHPHDTARQTATAENVSGDKPGLSVEDPDSDNALDKPKSNGHEPVSGSSGVSGAYPEEGAGKRVRLSL